MCVLLELELGLGGWLLVNIVVLLCCPLVGTVRIGCLIVFGCVRGTLVVL